MDFTLRCNTLKCRSPLNDRAVVTTCSHIFCVQCSDSLGLSASGVDIRICPACQTQLGNPDDAVVTQLNPTEDYKTSVLSGLNPSLIMECASRGIAFFQYQTSQEIIYQDCTARNLKDNYSVLNTQLDNVITEANAEIMALRDKLTSLHNDKKSLEQKNQELANAFREKSKAQQRLQGLYQKLKSQQNAHHIEHAAADDVESVIHSINRTAFVNDNGYGNPVASQRPGVAHVRGNELPGIYSHARMGSNGSGGSGRRSGGGHQPGMSAPQGPSTQRMEAPQAAMYAGRANQYDPGNAFGGGSMRHATPNRQPLGPLDRNVMNSAGNNGYGLSGSAKVGRGNNGQFSRSAHTGSVRHVLHR